MNSQSCKHPRWYDDSEQHEACIVEKCEDCGIFRPTSRPNPKFSQEASDTLDAVEAAKLRAAASETTQAAPAAGKVDGRRRMARAAKMDNIRREHPYILIHDLVNYVREKANAQAMNAITCTAPPEVREKVLAAATVAEERWQNNEEALRLS